MKRRTTKVILDILLVGALVFEMFYTLTGNAFHEVVGALFFVTLIAHMVFGRRFIGGLRMKSASERGLTGKQKAMSFVMIALLVIAVLLLASSILISHIITSASGWMLPAAAYDLVAFLHMVCAYIVCGVTIVHVGLHWISLFKAFSVPYDPARRSAISTGVTAAAALGVIAVSAVAAKEVAGWGLFDEALGGTAQAEELNGSNNGSATTNNGALGSGTTNGDADVTTDKRGKRKGGAATQSAPQGTSPSAPQSTTPSAPGSSQGDSSSNGSSSSSATGYCTLCHKRCPLSAPQCDKPYVAGLL